MDILIRKETVVLGFLSDVVDFLLLDIVLSETPIPLKNTAFSEDDFKGLPQWSSG